MHLYLNENKKIDEDQRLRKEVVELMETINNGVDPDELNELAKNKAYKYLKLKKKKGIYVAEINSEAIKEANKYHGMMALVSNKEKISKECLEKYRLREKIEENFEIIKDDCDGKKVRCWSDTKYQGRLFVQFVALGYYDFMYSEINRIKKEVDNYISINKTNSEDLKIYRSLKMWLHDMSLERILMWFDTVEKHEVTSRFAKKYWTTETTKRDKLFFKLLGIDIM